jgi:hypothetical protein
MQKLINVLAVTSFLVSSAVIGGGVYVYTQRDSIIEKVKAEAIASVKELLGTSQLGSVLVGGVSEDVDVTDEALGANLPVELPVSPF